ESPFGSPLILRMSPCLRLKVVTLNTLTFVYPGPEAEKVPVLALIVVLPLIATLVPGKAPRVVFRALTVLRALVTAGTLKLTVPEGDVPENWPGFAAEKSMLPFIEDPPPVTETSPDPPTPMFPMPPP